MNINYTQALSETFTRLGYANFLRKGAKGGEITLYLRNQFEIFLSLNEKDNLVTIEVVDEEGDPLYYKWAIPYDNDLLFDFIENMIKKYEMKEVSI